MNNHLPYAKKIKNINPSSTLHLRLDECVRQFKELETERKKTETILAQHFGRRVSSCNKKPIPRLSRNPSGIDRIIVENFREIACVETLIRKMEQLNRVYFQDFVKNSMMSWIETLKKVQYLRQQEIINTSESKIKSERTLKKSSNEKEMLELIKSIENLIEAERNARTMLWAATQITIDGITVPKKRKSLRFRRN